MKIENCSQTNYDGSVDKVNPEFRNKIADI